MRKLPLKTLIHYGLTFAESKLKKVYSKNPKLTRPIVGIFQPTLQCNFHCPYCDDGTGKSYPYREDTFQANLDQTKAALKAFKKICPAISVSGGEITLRSDLVDIFKYINELNFNPVGLNTNGFLLDKYFDILDKIDYLIVSLDSFDPERKKTLSGVSHDKSSERVLKNINHAIQVKKEKKMKFDIIINTLILPETISDAWGVFEFCLNNDLYWSPMPHIHGVYPNPNLIDNSDYEVLIEEVIKAKKAGARIFGTLEGLKIMKTFKRFECYPMSRLTMTAEGDIYYPCPPIGQKAGNLVNDGIYKNIIKSAEKNFGIIPSCDSRCHINCYLEGSLLLSHPMNGVKESLSMIFPKKNNYRINLQKNELIQKKVPTRDEIKKIIALPPETVRSNRTRKTQTK